ncbi:MAG: hypothetical protein PHR16_08280 [Methylovulum sp.]|nr:hypothetical protein [Methylovulum sp.]
MKTDFKNAYDRHQKDAEILFDKKRYANADQLYGLAAECALKAVMIRLDPALANQNGDLVDKNDRKHIDKLWGHFRLFLNGRNAPSYLAHISNSNPFSTWQIDDRYANQKSFIKNNVQHHKQAVDSAIANLVAHARSQGEL